MLFFAITAMAVAFVYLYVVPQLSSSLTAEKLERLEQQGSDASGGLAADGGGAGPRAARVRRPSSAE